MIFSSMATALADRYSVDLLAEMSRCQPEDPCIVLAAPVIIGPSKDQIFSCRLNWSKLGKCWLLDVTAKHYSFCERSMESARIALFNRSLPAIVMVGASHKSILITRIVEASPALDPFFLRDDVIVESIDTVSANDLDHGRLLSILTFDVTF